MKQSGYLRNGCFIPGGITLFDTSLLKNKLMGVYFDNTGCLFFGGGYPSYKCLLFLKIILAKRSGKEYFRPPANGKASQMESGRMN